MHPMKLAPVVAGLLGAASLLLAGCPPEATPCESSFDCGVGFTCVADLCTANAPPDVVIPPVEGEGEGGEGEGEGEGEVVTQLINDKPLGEVSMFLPATAVGNTDARLAVVGEYTAGGVDQLRLFDLVAADFVTTTPFIDVLNSSIGGNPARCNVDNVSFEPGIDPRARDDELWFSCAISGLQQVREGDLQNEIVDADSAGADLIVRLLKPDTNDNDIDERRVYAARGSDTVVVEQVNFTSTVRAARARDTFAANVRFGEIAGLFLATETDDSTIGDVVLVFDRAYPGAGGSPALVPIERPFDGLNKVWTLARDPWVPLVLPAGTHAVQVGDIPNPATLTVNEVQAAQQNLAVFVPTRGLVAFARIEAEMNDDAIVDDDSNGFNVLTIDTAFPAQAPPSTDRILLAPVPGAPGSVFYVLRGNVRAYGWKLKLHQTNQDDFDNDVENAQFVDETADDPNGLVTIPGVDSAAWISLAGNRQQLHRILFDIGF